MGWFKSAEEKAEILKKGLIEKYGAKDAQLIFEDKITEQEILNKKEKEKNQKIVLDYLNEEGVIEKGFFFINTIKSERPKLENATFAGVMGELVEKQILYRSPFETWEGSSIPDDRGILKELISIRPEKASTWLFFTKECLEGCIEDDLNTQQSVISLLEEKSIKMAVADIAAFLKRDFDIIKDYCEFLYNEGKINFAGNGRYFILNEDKKKKPKKAAPKTEEVDVEKELEKYKGLLDKGLITQEEYDTKRKQILGL